MIDWKNPQLLMSAVALIGGIGATIGVAAKTAAQRRPKETENVYGDARFMSPDELKKSGLLVSRQRATADGIYIGAWRDQKSMLHYLRDVSNTHVLMCGPTRSGKKVSCIAPTLLSYRGSCIINDEKGELYVETAPWREKNIGPVIRWEPGALEDTASWNPLGEVRLETPREVGDAQNIALGVIDIRGHGLDRLDHWQKAAVPLLAGLILHELYEAQEIGKTACMGDVTERFSDPADDGDTALFEQMRDNRHLVGAVHPFVAAEGAAQLKRSDRERSGVSSTLRTYLTLFADPVISANTNRSDFCLADIADGDRPVTIYVTTPPDDVVRLRPLVRLFLTMATRSLMAKRLVFVNGQATSPHRHNTLIIGDEFASFGRLEEIEASLAKCASWGIRFLLAIQDLTQLDGIYGPRNSIIANTHTRAFFPTSDLPSAEILSKSTGTMTANTPHTTIMGRRIGFMGQVTRTIQQTPKPLLTPGQILAMKAPVKDDDGRIIEPGEVLIFMTGWRPFLGEQLLGFQDQEFAARTALAA